MTDAQERPAQERPAQERPAAAVPRGGLRGLLGGTVGVALWSLLVLGLLVAGVVLAVQLRDAEARRETREQALQAARQVAVNLTSVDGEDTQTDLDRVLEGATGTFRTEFEAQAEGLRELVAENRVTSEGAVLEAALLRADESAATALVVVDATVANADVPDGQVRPYRMQIELERVGDRWLAATVQFVA